MLKPGMVSSLSRVPPVWPSERPEIMGTRDAGRVFEAGGGDDGGDEEGGFVADAAGGVLVDGEGVEGRGVEGFAGEAHGGGEGGELAGGEAAVEDGHEEGGDLGVGDAGRSDDGVRRSCWISRGRRGAWPSRFLTDEVQGVEGIRAWCGVCFQVSAMR